MRILLLGGGAREHALALALSKDPSVEDLVITPGNAGMESLGRCVPGVDICDGAAVTRLAEKELSDLVVIGPENPLVAGVADALRAAGIAVFGPNKAAARIEGSKAFAKDVMAKADVVTARAVTLEPDASDEFIESTLDSFGPPWVVKDDGLAAGKGVVVTKDRAAARHHVDDVHSVGNPVLVESYLTGPEVSLFCLVDGDTVVPLLPAQDHKRVFDNDEGPNTGGMGAYSPLPWLPDGGVEKIVTEVVEPVAKEMVARGCGYSGLLYAGLAWGPDGPAVVEFNCRFGDPETQAVLALLDTPLAGVLNAVATGHLAELPPLKWKEGSALVVVLAAENYPGTPVKGDEITGIHDLDDGVVLHAGTARTESGALVSNGGRVLGVVGVGRDLAEARTHAYHDMEKIHMRGGHYRTDIALPAVSGDITV